MYANFHKNRLTFIFCGESFSGTLIYILLFTIATIMLFRVRLIEFLQNEYKYLKIVLILWLIMLSFQEDKLFN